MKRLCFALCMIMIAAVAYSAPGDKRPAVTSAAIGLGSSSSPTLASVTATTSVTAPAYNSTAADGYHYVLPYNSVVFAGTPSVGMIQTTPTGPQWYTGSAWEAIGGASAIADLTDWPSGLTATELGYLNGATSNIQAQINAISVGSPVTTAPTYSDQSCMEGQYAFDASYAYFCRATNTWDRIALGGWSNPSPVAPTFSSFTINSAGTGLTAALSASTTVGAGGSGGLALSCSTAGAVAATYSSGSPGTSYTYTISPTVYSGDACTAAYTQPGNGLESTTGGSDVAGFSGAGVTNNSMQGGSASITDHFDTDTRANFTQIGGPNFIYNSSSHVITSDGSGGGVSMRYHNTSLGSPDQTLEALIEVTSAGNSAAIMRCSGAGAASTGYRVGIENNITNKLAILPVSGTSSASPIFFTTPGGASSFDTNGTYRVKFVVSGNTWHAYIDLNNNGSFNDANEDFGTITDSTYTTGNYVGVYFPSSFSNIKFDDLIATGN